MYPVKTYMEPYGAHGNEVDSCAASGADAPRATRTYDLIILDRYSRLYEHYVVLQNQYIYIYTYIFIYK